MLLRPPDGPLEDGLVDRLAEACEALEAADWRVYEVVVTAVRSLAPQAPDAE